jgi:hypothetical protein
MNYQEPLKLSQVNFSKVVYPKQRQTQNKKIILVKLLEKNKQKNFVFQTPTILNISKPIKHNGYYEIELALEGKDKKKVNKLINFFNDLETKVKHDAQYNGGSWFNLNGNSTINFQKIIRESDDYSNGTIKLKILKNSDFETIVQQDNNKKILPEDIMEDSWCKMILEVYAIWVNSNNDFGIFFRPILMSFSQKEEQYNYKFIESDDEDENNEITIPETEINNVFVPQSGSNSVFVPQSGPNNLFVSETPQSISSIINIHLSDSNFSSSSDEKEKLDAETSDDE